ncbi:MAG TPA: hypothetical protein PK074_08980 [Spirochaetales bacterium]|nr:hypothetical protein [Spirochaetales bacterium]HPD80457.1 hypothetical protein [Spirochaetales bacterium]HQK34845.1 hypothetical protein [Spirochaetales bacterium]
MIDKSNKNSSSQELEQYGIWVKSEPQDIEEPEEMAISAETDQELTFETVEELESPLVIETLDDFTAAPETSEFENEFNEKTSMLTEDDSIIDIPLETLIEQSSPIPPKKQTETVPEIKEKSPSLTVDEVSLDDFLDTTTEESSSENTTVNIDDFLQQDENQNLESEEEPEEIESIDIDLQFDDTIETPLDTLEDDFASVDLDSFDTLANAEISEFETTLQPPSMSSETQNDEEIDVSSMFMDNEPKASTRSQSSKPPVQEQADKERKTNLDAFIDNEASLPITELSMEEIAEEPIPGDEKSTASSDISITILNQIAQELASIKSELASLKSQIQTTQSYSKNEAQKPNQQSESKGFFEEEDDETIALTGDELDNILNTASFTVEARDLENAETQSSISDASLEESVETLLPEDGNYSNEKGIEIIDGEQEIETLSDESEKIDFNANEIVDTLTPFTELQEDEIQLSEQPDLEVLEEIPLEEPDLSQIDLPKTNEELLSTLEANEEEPSINFSHPDENVLDRIVLSLDGNEQVTETVNEVQSIPEIEETPINQEPIELLEEMPLQTIEDESISIKHPDELKTQLDDSLFIDTKDTEAKESFKPATQQSEQPSISEAPNVDVSVKLKKDIKTVLLYLDQLLTALPEDKIEEFANSEYYDTYKKLFEELGII